MDKFSVEINSHSIDSVKWRSIDFSLSAGEIVGLIGRNGIGKTTLLRMLCGLEEFDGSRKIFGSDVHGVDDRVQMLAQRNNLLPWKTVRQNLLFAMDRSKDRNTRWQHSLEQLGCSHLSTRWPANLSGGELRSVEIARILTTVPSFLMLDEPFVGLDIVNSVRIKEILVNLAKKRGGPHNSSQIGMLIVSHNLDILNETCSKYVALTEEGLSHHDNLELAIDKLTNL